jgi:thiosulfate/3-mercaptopyruvate sulfurtransferase
MNKRILKVILMSLIIVFLFIGCSNKQSSDKNTTEPVDLSVYKNSEIFITAEELNSKLGNEDIVILDANKKDLYGKGHIPGAVNIGFQGLCKTEGKPGDEGWGTILDREDFINKLGQLGINNDKLVVAYSDVFKGPGADGRAVWQMKMSGFDNVKLLYGGLQAWKDKGYELSTEEVTPVPTEGLAVKDFDESYRAEIDYVYDNLDKVKMVDVRSKKEFEGDTSRGEARGGHIKGAIHLEWTELLNEDATPKKPEEIIAIMKEAGITPEDDFVVY